MSTKHYNPTGKQVMHDITVLTNEELSQQYGIEFVDDGTIWDPVEYKTFANLHEWATHILEQENEDNYNDFMKFGGKRYYDDD